MKFILWMGLGYCTMYNANRDLPLNTLSLSFHIHEFFELWFFSKANRCCTTNTVLVIPIQYEWKVKLNTIESIAMNFQGKQIVKLFGSNTREPFKLALFIDHFYCWFFWSVMVSETEWKRGDRALTGSALFAFTMVDATSMQRRSLIRV